MPANQGSMPLLRCCGAFFGGSTNMACLRRWGSDFVLWEFFNRLLDGGVILRSSLLFAAWK